MGLDWPFADPANVAVFTLRQIVEGGQPILHVTHDEDGSWQFLSRGRACETDAMVVSLADMLRIDANIKRLAGLPLGWLAWRRTAEEEWTWTPKQRDGH
jgi:hypothetical protein